MKNIYINDDALKRVSRLRRQSERVENILHQRIVSGNARSDELSRLLSIQGRVRAKLGIYAEVYLK